MLDFDISYSSKSAKVSGPERVSTKTVEELFEFIQGNLVLTAKEFLKKEQEKNGFPKKEFLTIVDGKIGADELTVKPLGKIEYVTKLEDISAVVIDVFKLIAERTAVRTGYYSSMHVLMYNGSVVAKGYSNARAWLSSGKQFKPTDRFRIINLAPYARKIERLGIKRGTRGQDKGKNTKSYRTTKNKLGAKVRAPNGAYWLARAAARRRFPQLKNNIKFSFVPISPSVASRQNPKTFSPNDYKFKTGKGKGRPYLYPSISISINPGSFTSSSGFTESGDKL